MSFLMLLPKKNNPYWSSGYIRVLITSGVIDFTITDDCILNVECSGEIALDDFKNAIAAFQSYNDLPSELKIHFDFSRSRLLIGPEHIDELIDLVNSVSGKYQSVKSALLVDGPHETAISMIYMNKSKNNQRKMKLFNNSKAATEWLAC
jgi:hypothetical protein